MRYGIQFGIGARWSATSKYSLKEFCIAIVDKFSLTEREVNTIVKLAIKETFQNKDLRITRIR